MTKRIRIMTQIALLAATCWLGPAMTPAGVVGADELPTMQVWKTPTCGCCGVWVDHMRDAGFELEVTNLSDVSPVKQKEGIPPALASCHTAVVGDYVVEGHVPAEDVKRLLVERPDILGIAVAGMPAGSPGMESATPQPYDVIAIHTDGSTSVFASH